MVCEARSSQAPVLLEELFMKLDSLNIFDLATVPAGSRHGWVRVMALSLVLTGSFLLQGCLAGAWVVVVALDSMRNTNVTFWPFEQSWVAQQDLSDDAGYNSKVTSVAVLPVEGDPEMGARLATLLQQETTLRVESPETVVNGISAALSATADDADRGALAKEVARDLGVDTVLVSRVAGSPSHPSDWGWKGEGSRRLYLYLVDHDGHLLWKDELPFTLVKGSTPPLETSVQIDLGHHVMQHVKELHLDELGYLPKKIS